MCYMTKEFASWKSPNLNNFTDYYRVLPSLALLLLHCYPYAEASNTAEVCSPSNGVVVYTALCSNAY